MTYTGSQAQAGRGTIVSIGPVAGTTSPTYVPIEEAKMSSVEGTSTETVDVTNFNSGTFREKLATLANSGSVSITCNRVSSDPGQQALNAAVGTLAEYMFQVTLPKTKTQVTTGDVLAFNAYVSGPDIGIEVDKEVSSSYKLEITGPITITEGS